MEGLYKILTDDLKVAHHTQPHPTTVHGYGFHAKFYCPNYQAEEGAVITGGCRRFARKEFHTSWLEIQDKGSSFDSCIKIV